jgi:hypothetical protein
MHQWSRQSQPTNSDQVTPSEGGTNTYLAHREPELRVEDPVVGVAAATGRLGRPLRGQHELGPHLSDLVCEQPTHSELGEVGHEVFERHPEGAVVFVVLVQLLAQVRCPLATSVGPGTSPLFHPPAVNAGVMIEHRERGAVLSVCLTLCLSVYLCLPGLSVRLSV